MKPRELVLSWIDAFNRADANVLAGFYTEGATKAESDISFELLDLRLPVNKAEQLLRLDLLGVDEVLALERMKRTTA